MGESIQLNGAGNEGNRSFFIFTKTVSFLPPFVKFLIDCGFSEAEYQYADADPASDGGFVLPAENALQHFANETYDIDVAFTSNRIMVIVRSSVDTRERISAAMRRIAGV